MSYNNLPTNSEPLPAALAAGLSSLGRTRGSSATPVVSPTPNRNVQSTVNQFNQMNFDDTVFDDATNNRPDTPYGFTNRGSGSSQNTSFGTSQFQPNRQYLQQQSPQVFTSLEQACPSAQGFGSWNQGFNSAYQPPPGTFQPPSTTRQGTTQNPAVTAPIPSASSFPSFSRESSAHTMPSRGNQSGDQGTPEINHIGTSSRLQTRLHELQKTITRTATIPRAVQDKVNNELRNIGQEYNERQRLLVQEIDRTRAECDDLKAQVEKLQRQIQSISTERDRGFGERDALRKELSELQVKHRKSSDNLRELVRASEKHNEDLEKRLDEKAAQLRLREEQATAKRTIWKDPSSSSKHSGQAAARDPFNTPSGNHGHGTGMMLANSPSPSIPSAPTNTSYQSQSMKATTGPFSQRPIPTGPANQAAARRRPQLPSGRAQQANQALTLDTSNIGSRQQTHVTTEPGGNASKALVIHSSDQALADMYTDCISKVFGLIEGWVNTYSGPPNPEQDRQIARSNDALWEYMCNLTYPFPGQHQDAYTHVMTLLQSNEDRHWFIMRMCSQYVVKDVMDVEAFKTYSPHISETINYVKMRLKERGLANASRQVLIDQQSAAVQSVIAAENYTSYRSAQIGHHSKKLRDMLGPLLRIGTSRLDAGKDLGALAIYAWDLSVRMHTSRMSFQVYFPETSAKFGATVMVSKDKPARDPMQLQIAQVRLKLVITPVITMRNDTGDSIMVKNLHRANVLVMH